MRARLLVLLVLVGCGAEKPSPKAVPEGMVWIPAGSFEMGTDDGLLDERPRHRVELDGFWMDRTEVTNRQFAAFVAATGYVTIAEMKPNPKDFPGALPETLVPGALVFVEGKGWSYVPGASWRHPEGPKSTIEGKEDHPVVQVAWDDAVAYAKWAGKDLPTEAQFEYAARGGKAVRYAWGDAPPDDKKPMANIWQGTFPEKNLVTDGFRTTAPVGSFPKNGYGLSDMAGNVWEWCADWYRADAYTSASKKNPGGPRDSVDPDEPGVAKRLVRGGSFLCADCYCRGYRVTARMKASPDTGLYHTGFRCVINPK